MTIDTSKLGSWKTTIVGLLGAIVIGVYPLLQGGKPTKEQLIMAALTAAFGFVAKDNNVTGGTKVNSTNDPTVVTKTAVVKEPEK